MQQLHCWSWHYLVTGEIWNVIPTFRKSISVGLRILSVFIKTFSWVKDNCRHVVNQVGIYVKWMCWQISTDFGIYLWPGGWKRWTFHSFTPERSSPLGPISICQLSNELNPGLCCLLRVPLIKLHCLDSIFTGAAKTKEKLTLHWGLSFVELPPS